MIKQIFLERNLNKKRQDLVDCQEIASTGPAFENAWKQLAMRLYENSRQDPALIELLKKDGVQVHENTNPSGGPPPMIAPSLPTITPKASTPPTPPAKPTAHPTSP